MKSNKKRERGRPKISKNEKRSELMQFRVTEADSIKIKSAANTAGLSVSDWLRKQITGS